MAKERYGWVDKRRREEGGWVDGWVNGWISLTDSNLELFNLLLEVCFVFLLLVGVGCIVKLQNTKHTLFIHQHHKQRTAARHTARHSGHTVYPAGDAGPVR